MKTLIVGLTIKLFLVILYWGEPARSQTSCTAMRQWPYRWAQTGSLTLVLNGSSTGNRTYILNYVNTYVLSRPGYPLFGIRTFKTSSSSSFVDFFMTVTNLNFTSATFEIRIGSGYWIQYLEINYFIDQFSCKAASFGAFSFYVLIIKIEDTQNSSRTSDPNYAGNITRVIDIKADFTISQTYNTTSLPAFTNRLVLFLRIMNMTSTQGNLKNLKMYDIEYVDRMRIKLAIYKPLGVIFQALGFHSLYYSTATDSKFYWDIFWGGSTTLLESGGTFYTGNTWATSFMITGLAFMQFISDSSVIDYQVTQNMNLISTATVFLQKPYSTSSIGLKSTTTSYFHTFRWYCSVNGSHYLNTVDRTCYASCPIGTQLSVTLGKCFPCGYTCATCVLLSWDPFYGSNSTCVSCNASRFRTLINGSCMCNSGYFDDGYSSTCRQCSSVNNLTSTCTFTLDSTKPTVYYQQLFTPTNWTTAVLPFYKSLTCLSGYIVFNNLCTTCSQVIPYCISCANATSCITCNTSTTKYTDQKCYLCNLTNCVLCKQDNVCDQCATGYILLQSQCTTCSQAIPYCISCTNSTVCLNCNASATKYTDQKCYLCNLTNCVLCKQDNFCAQCATGYIIHGIGCIFEPCSTSCSCGGFYIAEVNGSCGTLCGDGFMVGTQECDDNNTNDRDGCSSSCKIQKCSQNCSCSGWYFPVVNGFCSTLCGDGFKVSLEQCDDSNLLNHDGCSSLCKIETCRQNCSCAGYVFPVLNDTCSTTCSDGIMAGMEECDDANTVSGDGCSSACAKENCSTICACDGWRFPFVNGICTPVCGDNLIRGAEECDDGNLANYDGCSSSCKLEGCNITCNCSGWSLPRINGSCTTVCGDGTSLGTQECDDGNTINGDGCSSVCKSQPCNESCLCNGYSLPKINGSCSVTCGDGIKTTTQQCDDGNSQSHDDCNSVCMIETLCNQSCSCDGWVRPFLNGSCSTVCGDGMVRGQQQCDDSNAINHDGCNSMCKLQTECSQSCLCGGWTKPYVNGSCSTICGDGIVLGQQQCDDNNSQLNDGCTSCKLDAVSMKTSQTQQFLFFTQQKTYYASLALFCMGFRIIGIQMLWVLQSFQLLLDAQPSNMKISSNIHGYSDPTDFPFKLPNLQTQLLDKFNYMFFSLLFVFVICTLLETLGECCRSGNQVMDSMGVESALTFTKGPNGFKQRQYQFEEDRNDDGNEEFTVHFDKKSTFKNDLMYETQALSVDMSQLQAKPEAPTYLSRLSRKILRQIFFDMVINLQPVLFSTLAQQVIKYKVQGVLNFPTLITFSVTELFFVGSLLVCWIGGEYFGENHAKFHQHKFMRYWLVISVEKVFTSTSIGSRLPHYLYILGGIKFLVLIYFSVDKVYYSKAQNYRCMAVNALHLVLYTGFIVHKVYLVPQNVNKLPPNFMEWGYTTVMIVVVGITAIFYFTELTSNCEANTRQVTNQNDIIVHERLFYSKKDIKDSGTVIQSKINPSTFSIIEQTNSKKFVPKSTDQNCRIASKHQLPEPDQRPSDKYDDSYNPKKVKFTYKAKPQRKQDENGIYEDESHFRNIKGHDRYQSENHFRETKDEFGQSRYAKSTKGRSFMKTRQAGNKNNEPIDQNPNKEITLHQSPHTQDSQLSYQNNQNGSQSAYRQENLSKHKQQSFRKAKSRRHVKSFKEIRNSAQQKNVFQSYAPLSIRFK